MPPKDTDQSTKPAADTAEAQERQRQREAEARRIQLEAQQLRAREQERRDREARTEQQTLVAPITIKNGDGTYVAKDEHGRVKESLDAHNVTRTFEYDEKNKTELRAFTENNIKWTTEDGVHWNADGQKTRTMHVVVNPEDGAFGIVESTAGKTASTKIQFLNGSLLTKIGDVTELRDKENALIKRTEGNGAEVHIDPVSHTVTLSDKNVQMNSQNQVQEVTYTDGSKAQFTYDDNNRLLSFTSKNGCFDATLMTNAQVDANGVLSYEQPAGTLVTIGLDNKEVRHDLGAIDTAASDIQKAIVAGDAKKIEDILTQMPPGDHKILEQRYQQLTTTDLHTELTTKFSSDDVNATKLTGLLNRHTDSSDEVGQIQLDMARIRKGNSDATSSMTSVVYNFVDGLINQVLGTSGVAPLSTYMAGEDWKRATEAEQDLLHTIGLLGPKELDSFKNDFRNQTGQTIEDYIAQSPISQDTKDALSVYLAKGRDERTTADDLELAKTAIDHKNLAQLQSVVLLSHNREELTKQLSESGYKDKLATNFQGDALKSANDYLNQGGLSVLTLLEAQHHIAHTDRAEVERIVKNASPDEAKRYQRGLYLASHPNEIDQNNESDAKSLKFYNDTKTTLSSLTYSRTEVLKWESQLMKKESLLGQFTDAANDPQRLYAAVEKLSKDDWEKFRANKDDLQCVEDLLNSSYKTTSSDELGNSYESTTRDIASPEVTKKVMEMLNSKLKIDDQDFKYEQSKTVGNRPIAEIFDTDLSTVEKFQALIDTSDEERQAIKENRDGSRDKLIKQLDKICNREGGNSTLKLARQLLKEIDDGTKPTALDRAHLSVYSDYLDSSTVAGTKPSLQKVHEWENAFKENKDLLKGLQTHTDRDNELSFDSQLKPLLRAHGFQDGEDKFNEFKNQILQNGKLDLAHCLKLTDKKDERLEEFLRCSDAEKAMLKEANPSDPAVIEFQKSVFKDENEKLLVQSTLSNSDGKMTTADKFFAYTKGDAYTDIGGLQETLTSMSKQERQDIANEYFQKYHQLLSTNLADKLPQEQRFMFKELLSGTDFNARQLRMDTTNDNDSHRSYADGMLATFWNGGKLSVNESANQMTDWLNKNPEAMRNLKPEDREKFLAAVKNYQQAADNYAKDKKQFAEQFTDAAITVAVMGSGLMTGFTSTAAYYSLIAAAAVAGGTFKVVATRGIEGTDFDSSEKNIASLLFRGGSEAAFGLIGPEFGLARVGPNVAKKSVAEALETMAGKTISKDAQTLLTEELGNMSRQVALGKGEKFEELARKVLADGTKEEQELLASTLRKQVTDGVTTDLRENLQKKVLFELECAGRSGVIGTVAGATPELLATGLTLEKPEDMWERMKTAGISGAEGAVFFHFIFKGLSMTSSLRKQNERFFVDKDTVIQRDDKLILVQENNTELKKGDKLVTDPEKLKNAKIEPIQKESQSVRENDASLDKQPVSEKSKISHSELKKDVVLSDGTKVDAVTARTMQELNITPDTYVYRKMDPKFLDLKNSTVAGNPDSMAKIADPYLRVKQFPDSPELDKYGLYHDPEIEAIERPPGLNVTLGNDPTEFNKDGMVFIKIKVSDLLKQNGKIYFDVGTNKQGGKPLYITYDNSVPFELVSPAAKTEPAPIPKPDELNRPKPIPKPDTPLETPSNQNPNNQIKRSDVDTQPLSQNSNNQVKRSDVEQFKPETPGASEKTSKQNYEQQSFTKSDDLAVKQALPEYTEVRTADQFNQLQPMYEDLKAIAELRNKHPDLYFNLETPKNLQDIAFQQNKFLTTQRMDEKLLDGVKIWHFTADRNEPLIKDLMQYATLKYGNLPPNLRAQAYNRFARMVFNHPSEAIADFTRMNMVNISKGSNSYLGDYAKFQSGVCLEEATFLKMLGDQHKDWTVSLVVGPSANSDAYSVENGQSAKLNHAWTEFKFKSNEPPKVFDPRQRIYGLTYDEILSEHGTTHVPGEHALIANQTDAVTVESSGDKLFQLKGFDLMTGEAIVYEPNTGFVPQTTMFQSIDALKQSGWSELADGLYQKDGKACIAKTAENGTVFLFDSPAIKKVPYGEVRRKIFTPAPQDDISN